MTTCGGKRKLRAWRGEFFDRINRIDRIMKYETEKDWCLRLYAFVGLGYLATYYVLAKFAAPLRWRDLCFFPAGCYEVVFSWQAVAAAAVSAVFFT